MLFRFSVANFRSFDGEQELSFVASRESRHQERLADSKATRQRILQTAGIWGGNASGKSNLCKVFDFSRQLVVSGTRPDAPTGRIPFRLRENAAQEPTRLLFELLLDVDGEEKLFRYSFAVNGREVIAESLAELRGSFERAWFRRTAGQDGKAPAISLDWWERSEVSADDRQFARFVAKGTAPNQLFLHEAMDRNLQLLAPIFRWFRDQLIILEPGAPYLPLELEWSNRQELREYAAQLLDRAGTGIHALGAIEVPLSSIGVPDRIRDDLLREIRHDDEGLILRSPRGERINVFRRDGELVAARIVTYRHNQEGRPVMFETRDESDGTLRVLDLVPILYDLEHAGTRRTYVIDELDRSLHSQLSEALLRHYLTSRSRETRTQLVFTTHDVRLLDQHLFRRDEMWLIDRGPFGESLLESVADYQGLRIDKDVRKAYLEGRFSGVPHLRPFPRRGTRPAASVTEIPAERTSSTT